MPKPPRRIQRKRSKGWRMPENTVYVGRPGRFGNPFRPMFAKDETSVLEAKIRYRVWLAGGIEAPTGSRPHPDWIAADAQTRQADFEAGWDAARDGSHSGTDEQWECAHATVDVAYAAYLASRQP